MEIKGSRVAVIGGSIAGCTAAIGLMRAGCKVTVFEQITALGERGFSIGIPVPLLEELIERGYLPEDYPTMRVFRRWWVNADGTPDGRILWEQPAKAATNNWGLLWRNLRAAAEAATFREGARVESFEPHGDGVQLTTGDGEVEDFDVLIGADGYKSQVREAMHPELKPRYAGYAVWRGSYPESRLADHSVIDRMAEANAWPTVFFDGGHGPIHLLPGSDGSVEPGSRRVNWAVYAQPDARYDYSEPTSVPPGAVPPEQYAEFLQLLECCYPKNLADLIRNSPLEEVSIQPIYDLTVERYSGDRMLLIGDAGAITRPHTASGATKAIMDGLVLEQMAAASNSWEDVLAAYDEERTPASNKIVELSRRLGQAEVLDPPDWAEMSGENLPGWLESVLAGDRLYVFADADPVRGEEAPS